MRKEKQQIARVYQSVLVILSRLIGESITELSEDGSGDEEMDGGDDGDTSEVSNSFLLLIPSLSSWLNSPLITSFVVMKSFKRFTSDNFTGFTMKSSAPSSKHLQNFPKFQILFIIFFSNVESIQDSEKKTQKIIDI